MAFDMPVYMALGDGLTICMRVLEGQRKAHRGLGQPERKLHTLSRSTGYMTECSYRTVSGGSTWRRGRRRTAMPAKAPASMFAEREKLGGSAS